jgi:putative membrane-bound dehydrogenase-like protein
MMTVDRPTFDATQWVALLFTAFVALAISATTCCADEFPEITNTQKPGEEPPTAQAAADAITVPEGFKVTLFAGEPDVHQPIGFEIDDRGRLWIAECYTYTSRLYDLELRDRLVILEDEDQDGKFDHRTVFWDEGSSLTSVTLGYGYVWILNEGKLQRIPDKDGDDRPDGPPETLLDGFNVQEIGHNIVNGLCWGPNGWLYGRHGITASSYVGAVGTPQDARTALNCSIWRYHPISGAFEVVVNGTTNPWGLDYNEHGEFFFTNNVIGHLWHAVPGAHFERMFGVDFNPHLYELMPQTADHYHWDTGQKWTDSREAAGKHGELGGGHSHCGGMIYLGDNWPEKYRGSIFMCNTHGRRVNQNILERKGSGYVAKRAPDFLMANQPWFRGVELKYGPDGGVYVTDWTDLGECHDHDGVHRTSGRIYKVVYAPTWKAVDLPPRGIPGYTDSQLVALLHHENEWFVRRARRVLHERHLAKKLDPEAIGELRELLNDDDSKIRLRGLWALNLLDAINEKKLVALLSDSDEHLVVWALRILVERADAESGLSNKAMSHVYFLAEEPPSGLIHLYLASTAQRLPARQRRAIATLLASERRPWMDDQLELMIWYALEPSVAMGGENVVRSLFQEQMPDRLVRFVARRLSEKWTKENRDPLFSAIVYRSDVARQELLLTGVLEALRGRRKVTPPAKWTTYATAASQKRPKSLVALIDELQVVFGDGLTMQQLLVVAKDDQRDAAERRRALGVLVQNQVDGTADLLAQLVNDRVLGSAAIAGLASIEHPETARRILDRWKNLDRESRLSAVNTLVTRKTSAAELASALESGAVTPDYVSAFQARRMRAFNDARINARLNEHWGQIRDSSAEKRAQIESLRKKLDDDYLKKANKESGRKLFEKTCAKCHRLYGKGGIIGPDLTGSNRDNLDYVLENVVDPSAVLAASYRMSAINTVDGRVLNGVIQDSGGPTVKVLTPEKELILPREDLDVVNPTKLSLMPEGLLDNLTDEQIRDLIAFLKRK